LVLKTPHVTYPWAETEAAKIKVVLMYFILGTMQGDSEYAEIVCKESIFGTSSGAYRDLVANP
jgi:hypothetical protein